MIVLIGLAAGVALLWFFLLIGSLFGTPRPARPPNPHIERIKNRACVVYIAACAGVAIWSVVGSPILSILNH
jgi:hypothetical protein